MLPRDLRALRLEPSRRRQLLLPGLPEDHPRAEGVTGLSRVPDSGMFTTDGVRGLRDDAEAERRREAAGLLTACARR